MRTICSAALIAASLLPAAALAHDFTLGDLTIDHPMAYETAAMAQSGGGYMTITNDGARADRLVAVRADFPMVALHTTAEADGIARMSGVEAIDIPPGETVALRPGGLHVMFMGLGGTPLVAGEAFPATLVFEHAGEIEVMFHVEARDGADHAEHDHHD